MKAWSVAHSGCPNVAQMELMTRPGATTRRVRTCVFGASTSRCRLLAVARRRRKGSPLELPEWLVGLLESKASEQFVSAYRGRVASIAVVELD